MKPSLWLVDNEPGLKLNKHMNKIDDARRWQPNATGLTAYPCNWCPRECGIDRSQAVGFCGCADQIKLARGALHFGEEPCLSGEGGSGTIFFSGCNLRCCFCQNYQISSQGWGREISIDRMAEICLELQSAGAHNINLVTPTPYLQWVPPALDRVRPHLHIPVVYNCSGYEKVEVIEALQPYIDIYLPDLKYYSEELSWRYSRCHDYFAAATAAIQAMVVQCGPPVFNREGILQKGALIRHLVLPGARQDSIRIMRWLSDNLPRGDFMLSLMSQYTPTFNSSLFKEINRKITSREYDSVVDEAVRLGLTNGYIQDRSSAAPEYTPPFDGEGT